MRFVDKYSVRQFSALACDNGILLCDKELGSFMTLRYKEDLVNLKILLSSIDIIEMPEYQDERKES